MPSIQYDQVFSAFYTKVKAYDFLYDQLDDRTINVLMCSWLHGSVYYPMIRKLFNTVSLDDNEETITYTMTYSVDDMTDAEFLVEVLSDEMIVKWLEPKKLDLSTIKQHFSTSDAKFYSQSAHLEQIITLYDSCTNKVRSLIADRGGQYNTYLDGTSAAATMRSTS